VFIVKIGQVSLFFLSFKSPSITPVIVFLFFLLRITIVYLNSFPWCWNLAALSFILVICQVQELISIEVIVFVFLLFLVIFEVIIELILVFVAKIHVVELLVYFCVVGLRSPD
jgi:hypothetical protein